MKILFLGASEFSATTFNALNAVFPIAAVVCPMDKPFGRKLELKPCDLKIAAEKAGVQVMQYDKVSKTGLDDIRALAPDIAITAAFGQILSDAFLAIPKLGTLNIHASLLPKYRGASPIQASILNGDKLTGITVMQTVHDLDAGDMLLQKEIEIADTDTTGSLFDKLAVLGGEAIVEAVKLVSDGKAVFKPQIGWDGTYCRMIKKSDGKLDFSKVANELDCFVRAMSPWPSAYAMLNGKIVKVFKISKVADTTDAKCGTVLCANQTDGIIIACSDGAIRLDEIQAENSRRMSSRDFMRGFRGEIEGEILQ